MDLNKVGSDRAQQTQVSEQNGTQKSHGAKDSTSAAKAREAGKSASSQANSPVKWSADSQLVSEGVQLAKAAPVTDARAEKIAQIKAAIANGSYKTGDAKKIADRMIQSSLEDDLAAHHD